MLKVYHVYIYILNDCNLMAQLYHNGASFSEYAGTRSKS